MGPRKKLFLISLVFSLFCFTGLTACVQNYTDLANVEIKIFYLYKDKISTPEASICLYAQTNSDPRLLKEVQITSLEDKYIWNVEDIKRISIDGEKFVVCNNLVVPDGKEFSDGYYEISFKNYTDEETKLDYNFTYNREIYSKKYNEIYNNNFNELTKNIVIYNNKDVIIYYGLQNEFNNTKELISANYNDAAYYNEIWILSGGKENIIFPEEKIQQILQENKD